MTLSPDQFLPGTEHMRAAEPHEQTESQFHNRPDVFTHGRYVSKAANEHMVRKGVFPGSERGDFHAGTIKAAHERLQNLESPWYGHEPRFFHGRVDPMHMQNTPQKGQWEEHFPDTESMLRFTGYATARHTTDPGRKPDEMDSWSKKSRDSYYRNDYEDAGSTSVILSTHKVKYSVPDGFSETRRGGRILGTTRRTPVFHEREDDKPNNFQSWRGAVGDALSRGEHVPSHVRAAWEASGGAEGHHGVVHTDFQSPSATTSRYQPKDQEIPGLEASRVQALGKQWN